MTVDRRRARGLVVLALVVWGCTSDDPPTLELDSDAPGVTSDTLPDCRAASPGETKSPAGCIGEDGRVIRP
jgi:hypothetical protein